MKTDYKELTRQLETDIFRSPERAMGFGGWNKHGDRMQTRLRPDGTDGGRADKTTLGYWNGKLCMYHNGSSFRSQLVTTFLKERYDKDWLRIVCQMYGIRKEDFPATDNDNTFTHKDRKKTTAKPKPYAIGDESKVDCIPPAIVSMTLDTTRPDVLRQYLSGIFGEDATLQAWDEYGIGTTYDEGRTMFWNYDQQFRCRGGKKMAYTPDGHRDKKDEYGIISIPNELIREGKLPEDWKLTDCVFGEHFLARYPEMAVAVVESEKTAVICSILLPSYIWIATGGDGQKLDRVAALTKDRKALFFPDADANEKWKKRFGKSVNSMAYDYFLKNGKNWAKSDIADILLYNLSSKG